MFFKPSGRKKDLSDQDLLTAYRQTEDLEFLAALYDRYMHLVYAVCLKYLKDPDESRDAVMQVFEKLIAEALKIEIRNFGSWVHVISRNHCLMKLRAGKSENRHMDKFSREQIMEFEAPAHPLDESIRENRMDIMMKCIEQLPADQKTCVDLFFMQEKSYSEIVQIAGYELKKVKSYLQNGKRNIKICIEKNLDK